MKVLVTGAAGFVGSHVVRHLEERGYVVLQCDVALGAHSDFMRGRLPKVDAICHLGAIGDVYACERDPLMAWRVNALGSAHVAQDAKRQGAHLVYASTWEVYDWAPTDGRLLVESDRCAPRGAYNASKYAGELAITSAVPGATLLRLGTAYGVGMRSSSVFSRFAVQARKGEPLTIQGTGEQGREFVHATDIARAFGAAIEHQYAGPLNVTGDEYVTVAQLAALVAGRYGVHVTHVDARAGDVHAARVSNALARSSILWEPTVVFADGLRGLLEDAEQKAGAAA